MQPFEIQIAIKTVVLRLTLRLSCVIIRKPKDILDLCHEEEGLKCDPCESPLFEENRTTQGRKKEVTAQGWKRAVSRLITVSWGQEICQREYTSLYPWKMFHLMHLASGSCHCFL